MKIPSSSLILLTLLIGIPLVVIFAISRSGWTPPKCEYEIQEEKRQHARFIGDSIDAENRKCPFKMEKNAITNQWRILYWVYGSYEPAGWVDPEKEGKWPFGDGYATFDTYKQFLLKWQALMITRIPYGDSLTISHKLDSLKQSFFRKNQINNNWASQ